MLKYLRYVYYYGKLFFNFFWKYFKIIYYYYFYIAYHKYLGACGVMITLSVTKPVCSIVKHIIYVFFGMIILCYCFIYIGWMFVSLYFGNWNMILSPFFFASFEQSWICIFWYFTAVLHFGFCTASWLINEFFNAGDFGDKMYVVWCVGLIAQY